MMRPAHGLRQENLTLPDNSGNMRAEKKGSYMRSVMREWREFSSLNKRINTLDSGKRFINEELVEVGEQHNVIGLSESEIEKIKSWASLDGSPDFLGTGSKGSSYKFGNKVLKITSDPSEARACASILGKTHPNVYDVYKVGERSREDREQNMPKMAYAIVYGFLDYPNKPMVQAAERMYHKIRKNDFFYSWRDDYLKKSEDLIKDLLVAVNKDETILGHMVAPYSTIQPKIDNISTRMGWNDLEKALFTELWTTSVGMYNNSLDSPINVMRTAQNVFEDPKGEYAHQLALGLTFLNNNGVRFDDLKTSNVMEKNGQIAIIDIGYSSVLGSPEIPKIG